MSRSEELFNTARDHFNKAHYKLAEPLLEQIQNDGLVVKPDVPYMLGTIAFDRGKLKKAISLFKKAIEIDPSFTEASVGLSIILNDLGKYDEARKVFEDAYSLMKGQQKKGKDVHLKTKIANKHVEIAELYLMNQQVEEAVHEYEKASKLCPGDQDIALKLEEARIQVQEPKEAIGGLEESLRTSYNQKKHFRLVEAYTQSGQKNRAHFELDKMQVRNGISPEISDWRRRLDELDL